MSAQIDGAELLDRVRDFTGKYIAYPSPAAHDAHVLWIAHTYRMDLWDSTPRIGFLSPEPGSGKTRALEVTELLVPRPILAVDVSSSYLFRKLDDEAGLPTVLLDEIDTVFGPRAKEHEDLRGMLNSGHRKGAISGRSVVRGRTVETIDMSSYAAVALAGLNDLPDTLASRTVVLRMRRRAPNEKITPFRRRDAEAGARKLVAQLQTWTAGLQITSWPELPPGIEDRAADVWEALISIADFAGGHWPEDARVTAVTLVTDFRRDAETLGVKLLVDLREIFGDQPHMATQTILEALNGLVESPWGDLKGSPLDARGLARRLGRFGVKRTTIRIGDAVTAKGYRAEDLSDPWSRYLPPMPEKDSEEALPMVKIEVGVSREIPDSIVGCLISNDGNASTFQEPPLPLNEGVSASPGKSVTSVTSVTGDAVARLRQQAAFNQARQ
jgi:hypothetical protein